MKIAAVYLCVGVLLGMTMGIIHDFRLTSVHAHINLLGWVSMGLFGLIYHFYPAAANTKEIGTHTKGTLACAANFPFFHSLIMLVP